MSDDHVHIQNATPTGKDRRRLIAWLLLGPPLLIYVIFWPVKARLDRGVIEEHSALSIWKQMIESLPTVGAQTLFEAAFVLGLVAFMAGALALVWLALDRTGQQAVAVEDPPLDLDFLPSE